MKAASITVTALLALAIGAFVRAYVICRIGADRAVSPLTDWAWYVVSAFTLPSISLSTAFDLSLLAQLFVQQQYGAFSYRPCTELVEPVSSYSTPLHIVQIIGKLLFRDPAKRLHCVRVETAAANPVRRDGLPREPGCLQHPRHVCPDRR